MRHARHVIFILFQSNALTSLVLLTCYARHVVFILFETLARRH